MVMNSFYERYKLYRLNPCDLDSAIPGGPALTYLYQKFFAIGCPCCAMVRILAVCAVSFGIGLCL
jgi:hypothetical protein